MPWQSSYKYWVTKPIVVGKRYGSTFIIHVSSTLSIQVIDAFPYKASMQ